MFDLQPITDRLNEATARYTAARHDAAHFEDEDLSIPARDRRRAELAQTAQDAYRHDVDAARAALDAAQATHQRNLDRVPDPQGSTRDAWDRARMLLDSGRTLAEVVATADRETLLALKEWAPTYLETIAPAPAPGEARVPVDLAPFERSLRTRWVELTGDQTLADALAQAPTLAALEVQLRHAEAVAAGNGHAAGLRGAVEAELAAQAAAATLPASVDAEAQA